MRKEVQEKRFEKYGDKVLHWHIMIAFDYNIGLDFGADDIKKIASYWKYGGCEVSAVRRPSVGYLQFYLCNPVKVFSCIVENANTKPSINIDHYVEPDFDRDNLKPEEMPTELLEMEELRTLLKKVPQEKIEHNISKGYNYNDVNNTCRGSKLDKKALLTILPFIDEDTSSYLILRDTDKISEAKTPYTRKK